MFDNLKKARDVIDIKLRVQLLIIHFILKLHELIRNNLKLKNLFHTTFTVKKLVPI